MDEKNRNSLKLDIEGVRLSSAGSNTNKSEVELSKETYKQIPEDNQLVDTNNKAEPTSKDGKMVQNGDNVHDGAEERMLTANEKEQLAKKDEVKFISGDKQNGDAKIDIGAVDKAFTGMTKEELMKYANDPFWIRLRWIFFILFWALWVAMLVGAILIIINAPKCAAPIPLVWYKQGPLVKYNSIEYNDNDLVQAEKVNAKGVIYELPDEETYLVHTPVIEEKIKKLVDQYKEKHIKVILDITPNYATDQSELFKTALEDETQRSAFIWINKPEQPNNWLSKVNGSAWQEIKPQNYVLSQFGTGKYDLQFAEQAARDELKEVLKHLVDLGVKGFRLSNVKHLIINPELKKEELLPAAAGQLHTEYGFWTHSQNIFQEGLGALMHEFAIAVNNATDGDGFLSVTEDIVRPELFRTKNGTISFDLPIYGRFPHILGTEPSKKKNRHLFKELENTFNAIDVNRTTFLQWNYEYTNNGDIDPSAYNIFLMLLPGVPVQPADFISSNNISESSLKHLDKMRLYPSYMHGSFDLFNSSEIVAYARSKSGNPGFFVVLNPTNNNATGNFSKFNTLPERMSVDLLSDNYKIPDINLKSKVRKDSIPLSPFSAVILTYVPVKLE